MRFECKRLPGTIFHPIAVMEHVQNHKDAAVSLIGWAIGVSFLRGSIICHYLSPFGHCFFSTVYFCRTYFIFLFV